MSHPVEPSADDGWGPSTSVRFGSDGARGDDGWSPAGPPPGQRRTPSRADRRIERQIENLRPARGRVDDRRHGVAVGANAAVDERYPGPAATADYAKAPERGLPWWAALIVLVVLAGIGGVVDTIGSISVRGGFNIGIVVASVVGILIVKRSHMFPIVIAPPIVYSVGALFQLYLRSSGLHDKKVVFDAAANYLVYGFPAIAAATAAVLIIAGLRMITRK